MPERVRFQVSDVYMSQYRAARAIFTPRRYIVEKANRMVADGLPLVDVYDKIVDLQSRSKLTEEEKAYERIIVIVEVFHLDALDKP